MKNSNDQSQDKPVEANEQCSEKKCVTCFENRGCIYEQYLGAAINKMEESYLANQAITSIQQIGKRA